MVLITVRGLVHPRATMQPEGLSKQKIPQTPIKYQTHDLPASSAMPQPTVPWHTPTSSL
jgi:hypothetical protein